MIYSIQVSQCFLYSLVYTIVCNSILIVCTLFCIN